MSPDDLFLLFTDGIYEADNAEETEYGQARPAGQLAPASALAH